MQALVSANLMTKVMDGLLYAFATTYIIAQGVHNNLVVILVVATATLLIFWDNWRQGLLARLTVGQWLLILGANYLFLAGLGLGGQSWLWLLLVVLIHGVAYSALGSILNHQMIGQADNLQRGLLNYATLNTWSTLIGFVIGASLSRQSLLVAAGALLFLLILAFLVLWAKDRAVLGLKVPPAQSGDAGRPSIRAKGYFWILGVMAATTAIWVPELVAAYQRKGLGPVWLPFVLPGLVALVILWFFRRYRARFDRLSYGLYAAVTILFFLAWQGRWQLMLATVIFAVLVGIGQLAQTTIRRQYFEANQELSRPLVLQSLSVNNELFLVIISLCQYGHLNMGLVVLVLNLGSIAYLLLRPDN
ncbi:hypothetical protein OZX65_06975 [Leuconostocaceae bacterium ESL0723]|nr:hypothetical protein OZX65_06975 [Leuconostocaceae bacterium ESL0723]